MREGAFSKCSAVGNYGALWACLPSNIEIEGSESEGLAEGGQARLGPRPSCTKQVQTALTVHADRLATGTDD